MKCIALVLALAGCLDNNDVTVDDVIKSLGADGNTHVADGHTPIDVVICTDSNAGLDPALKATLKASSGQWASPDSDPKATTFSMSASCETRKLTPTNDPTIPIVVSGAIGTFTKNADPIGLTAAVVETPVLSRSGSIGTMGTSTIVVTATLPVSNGGLPSTGTQISFVVEDTRTDAYFQSPIVFVTATSGSTVTSNLLIAQGAPVPVKIHVEVVGTSVRSDTMTIAF